MTKLPKRLIKKYGISKKAWSIFKGQRKIKRQIKRRVGIMPRKRKYAGRRGKGNGDTLINEVMGAGGTALYDKMLSPMIPIEDGVLKDGAEALGAHYLLARRGGIIGKTGKVMRAYKLTNAVKGLLGGFGI